MKKTDQKVPPLKHRIKPYPTGNNPLETLALRSRGLEYTLETLMDQINDFRESDPENPLVKRGANKNIPPVDFLEQVILGAQDDLASGNWLQLATRMYQVGVEVGKLNHVEGWASAKASRAGSAKSGRASKKNKWAIQLARWAVSNFGQCTEDEVWKQMPDPGDPLILTDEKNDWIEAEIYRDGSELVFIDADSRESLARPMAESTFFKSYYRAEKASGK